MRLHCVSVVIVKGMVAFIVISHGTITTTAKCISYQSHKQTLFYQLLAEENIIILNYFLSSELILFSIAS